mgnify:CR=1 FL=1
MTQNVTGDAIVSSYHKKQDEALRDLVVVPLNARIAEYFPTPNIFTDTICNIFNGPTPSSFKGARPLIQLVGTAVHNDEVSDYYLGINHNRIKDSLSDDTVDTTILDGMGYITVTVAYTSTNIRYLRRIGMQVSRVGDSAKGSYQLCSNVGLSYNSLLETIPLLPMMVKAFNTITRRLDRCNNTWRELPNFQNS